MKRFFSILFLAAFATVAMAQTFNEYDRKVFNEGTILSSSDFSFAPDSLYNSSKPIKLYSIENKGGETIVTFSHSIYFDSQWVTFGKGIEIVDCETGDSYKVRGYKEGWSMDKLLIVKGCNRKNILVSMRFPKLKRTVKIIDICNREHADDIVPSNNRKSELYIAKGVKVSDYKKRSPKTIK